MGHGKMASNFFVSDTHFGHLKIIEYGERPFITLDEMHRVMIERWNSVVTNEDTVYHLGDVCFSADYLPIMDKLNGGKKVLILGNHDTLPVEDYLLYFDEVHGMMKFAGYWITHCPMHESQLFGKKNIHGHVHQNSVGGGSYINVSVENIGYAPVTFQSIKDGSWKKRK
jgi:calcineurin-like phosphoesterase family protein